MLSRVTAGGSSWLAAGTGGGVVTPVRRTPEVPLGLQPDREEGARPERAGTPVAAFIPRLPRWLPIARGPAVASTASGAGVEYAWDPSAGCANETGEGASCRTGARHLLATVGGQGEPAAGAEQATTLVVGAVPFANFPPRSAPHLTGLLRPLPAWRHSAERRGPPAACPSAAGGTATAPQSVCCTAGATRCKGSASMQASRSLGRVLARARGPAAGGCALTRPRGRQTRATRSRSCASRARGAAGGWRARGRWSSRWRAWRPARCCTWARSRCASGTRARRAAYACPAWCAPCGCPHRAHDTRRSELLGGRMPPRQHLVGYGAAPGLPAMQPKHCSPLWPSLARADVHRGCWCAGAKAL